MVYCMYNSATLPDGLICVERAMAHLGNMHADQGMVGEQLRQPFPIFDNIAHLPCQIKRYKQATSRE